MNIIFGDSRESFPDNYTILELDQFRIGNSDEVVTAYCLVENIPLGDFPTLDSYVKIHRDLIQEYRKQNWEYCTSAIKGLRGKWNGELDSFYENLLDRVESYNKLSPGEDWDWVLVK
jgi:hypothetical protein